MWLKVILLKLSLHRKSENWDLFRLRAKIKGRRIPQQWIMINGTGRTATAPPAGCPEHRETERERGRERERESGATVPKRWVLKAPWKKDYGCLCWPSGSLPAAQVCKLLKAAELQLSPESFFTPFTLRTRWQILSFVQGETPSASSPQPKPTSSVSAQSVLEMCSRILTWCKVTSRVCLYLKVQSVLPWQT